jgi:hypothetical protein
VILARQGKTKKKIIYFTQFFDDLTQTQLMDHVARLHAHFGHALDLARFAEQCVDRLPLPPPRLPSILLNLSLDKEFRLMSEFLDALGEGEQGDTRRAVWRKRFFGALACHLTEQLSAPMKAVESTPTHTPASSPAAQYLALLLKGGSLPPHLLSLVANSALSQAPTILKALIHVDAPAAAQQAAACAVLCQTLSDEAPDASGSSHASADPPPTPPAPPPPPATNTVEADEPAAKRARSVNDQNIVKPTLSAVSSTERMAMSLSTPSMAMSLSTPSESAVDRHRRALAWQQAAAYAAVLLSPGSCEGNLCVCLHMFVCEYQGNDLLSDWITTLSKSLSPVPPAESSPRAADWERVLHTAMACGARGAEAWAAMASDACVQEVGGRSVSCACDCAFASARLCVCDYSIREPRQALLLFVSC